MVAEANATGRVQTSKSKRARPAPHGLWVVDASPGSSHVPPKVGFRGTERIRARKPQRANGRVPRRQEMWAHTCRPEGPRTAPVASAKTEPGAQREGVQGS